MRFINLRSLKWGRSQALAAVAVGGVLAMGAVLISSVLNLPSKGGSLSAYLIGAVNGQDHDCFGNACFTNGAGGNLAESDTVEAVVRLVNPTNNSLSAYVAAYAATSNGQPFLLGCVIKSLDRNEYAEVNLIQEFAAYDSHDFTVKVLTVDAARRVQAGAKGWLTHYVAQTSDNSNRRFLHMRETELQEVPIEVAKAGEAARIISDCPVP
jgi:hypothetical protein